MSWEQWLRELVHDVPSYPYDPGPMPMPMGQPYDMSPGMHTGAPYSMPGVLGNLPAWMPSQQGPLRPAPATFNAGPHAAPKVSPPGYYPQGTPLAWGRRGPSRALGPTPPPPYRYQSTHPAAMPAGAPMAVPYAHPYGENVTHGMQGTAFQPRPAHRSR